MTLNMKQVRLQTLGEGRGSDSEDSEDEIDPNSPAAIKRRHKKEMERAEHENRENTAALLELRDLEDEMTMLCKLFDAQEAVIKSMKTVYTSNELKGITASGQYHLQETLDWLAEYKQQAVDMLKRIETVRTDVSASKVEGY